MRRNPEPARRARRRAAAPPPPWPLGLSRADRTRLAVLAKRMGIALRVTEGGLEARFPDDGVLRCYGPDALPDFLAMARRWEARWLLLRKALRAGTYVAQVAAWRAGGATPAWEVGPWTGEASLGAQVRDFRPEGAGSNGAQIA